MLKKGTCILVLFLLCFLMSCNTENENKLDELPGITVPIDEMNIAFSIEDPPVKANSHENGQRLALAIRNLSDRTIVFPNDYGLRIFVFQDQTWNIVQNSMGYADGEKLLLTSDAFPPGLMAIAYPYIPGLAEPTTIRVVMIGHYENADSEVVGAYIDIVLH